MPDLLYINYKLIDEIGHLYSMNAVEMRDSVQAQDAELPDLIDLLNEHVGEGEWVMMLTADHGHTPDPAVSGASAIEPSNVAGVIQEHFDTDGDDVRIVEFTQPTHIFIDRAEMEQNGDDPRGDLSVPAHRDEGRAAGQPISAATRGG